jgi:hypothetical protein
MADIESPGFCYCMTQSPPKQTNCAGSHSHHTCQRAMTQSPVCVLTIRILIGEIVTVTRKKLLVTVTVHCRISRIIGTKAHATCNSSFCNLLLLSEIWGSDSGEDVDVLDINTVCTCMSVPKFQRCILPRSLGLHHLRWVLSSCDHGMQKGFSCFLFLSYSAYHFHICFLHACHHSFSTHQPL